MSKECSFDVASKVDLQEVDNAINRKYSGTGLGLPLTRGLVELHGGTISAHSEGKGQGASFRIRLPLTQM